jgi:hypothetical protein
MEPRRPFRSEKPIIGMVHLRPLPGSPRWAGPLEDVYRAALRDAVILAEEGADGILVENFGDLPFHPGAVAPITVASMAAIVDRLRREIPGQVAIGVNVLRNDAQAALAVASTGGASFVRVNVHCGAVLTDQGILEGRAHETLRVRASLAPQVAIFADARVKHGYPLSSISLAEEVADVCERGLADAVLITGTRTGRACTEDQLDEARSAAGAVPVLAASGITAENVGRFLARCDGVIVGTSIKEGGVTEAAVDRSRVRRLFLAAREARRDRSESGSSPAVGGTEE